MMNLKHGGTLALALSLAAIAAPADAATDTANLAVSASVTANCDISTSGLDLGSYDPIVAHLSSDLDGTGTINVVCTSGTNATITLDQGSNADTDSTDDAPVRRMSDGTNFLSYSLYTDAARTDAWGNTAATGHDVSGTGTTEAVTVYGRVDAGQSVPPGTYSDTVIATITF